jgi:hypothetical protein
MSRILLTGAGFSKNWGGWLANEAFEYLIGNSQVDDNLRSLLWRSKLDGFGFEDILAQLQHGHEVYWSAQVEQDLRNLTGAVTTMFAEMASGFDTVTLDPPHDATWKVRSFLAKFDAIYTLNQDTLLEQKYKGHLPIGFRQLVLPGIKPNRERIFIGGREYGLFTPSGDLSLPQNSQPYYKLHGSFNWIQERESLLIIGGNKYQNIQKHPLLAAYSKQFAEDLCKPDTKLMIIGYSFSDVHINDVIARAVSVGTKLFIIDPAGADVINKNEPPNQKVPAPLTQTLPRGIVGASRRPFLSTFRDDAIEYEK